MTLRALFLAGLLFLGLPASAHAEDEETVIFQGLDKVTARISTFEAEVGETVQFGTLEITVRRCQTSEPHEPPEDAVFVQVYEPNAQTGNKDRIFSGWMFSSNPALSALEHAVYDFWVKDCR